MSQERETRLLEAAASTGTTDIERSVRAYFEQEVRRRHHPDFTIEEFNLANIMTGTRRGPGVIGKNMQLARILNLNAGQFELP